MSTDNRKAAVKHLIDEAKKRVLSLIICITGLSYLMSLTSSSVLINMPLAFALIILFRYFSLGLEKRGKVERRPYVKPSPADDRPYKKIRNDVYSIFSEKPDWRRKVDSSVVEEAIDHLSRRLVSEWITDLWYSRLTPDTAGPEELVQIINGFLGDISSRTRNINLVNFLTRDVIDIICTHLELFRASRTKIGKSKFESLSFDQRDMELKLILSLENKLHPALFSQEAEHKVLQLVIDGVLTFTFKSMDLDCSFFRCVVRELLSCAVLKPILNLASSRFMNQRIELLSISMRKVGNGVLGETPNIEKSHVLSNISPDHLSKFLDPSVKGVELVNLKNDKYKSKDPLLSINACPLISPDVLTADESNKQANHSRVEWVDNLDLFCQRKNKALTSENFENMWAKGKNYKRNKFTVASGHMDITKKDGIINKQNNNEDERNRNGENAIIYQKNDSFNQRKGYTHSFGDEHDKTGVEGEESVSSGSSGDEDEQASIITGLDSPGTKVWDGRNNRNITPSHMRHPLEISAISKTKRAAKRHTQHGKLHGEMESERKWLSSERKLGSNASFLFGSNQSHSGLSEERSTEIHHNCEAEVKTHGRVHTTGQNAPSSSSSSPHRQSHIISDNFLMTDSFLRLQSEVLGANIVKGGSKPFTAYSISVTDVNKSSWSIKRRFSHFEELHRRLKIFSQYNLHLPPKHFLSTGLDIPIIEERCKLLDKYLKGILNLPEVAASIEVWDFLSVDSQTYVFSNYISILETLSIGQGKHALENPIKDYGLMDASNNHECSSSSISDSGPNWRVTRGVSGLEEVTSTVCQNTIEDCGNESESIKINNSVHLKQPRINPITRDKGPEEVLPEASIDPTLPVEWVPSNLYRPILDMVDVVFQLQDDGWIRRKAFWLGKQILQLGMGDAVDDWLIEKIQCLRKGSVVAAGIKKVEQIIWPDGIFITKHPRKQASSEESNRSAQLVHELIIERAPAAIVGLVGRKKYENCAEDVYCFLQSGVCLKQLALDILQLLMISIFPELDSLFINLHNNKQNFGELKTCL